MPVSVEDVRELGPFTFRWPTELERFEKGWDFTARAGPRRYRMRHGLGGREVYGRSESQARPPEG